MNIKGKLKYITPDYVYDLYIDVKQYISKRKNVRKSPEEIFTEIYKKKKWGSSEEEFDSGSGSTHKEIIDPYIDVIAEKASSEGFRGSRFVDLGCGNFRVGKQLLPLCSEYVGVDVVKDLIAYNEENFGSESVIFKHLDIIEDPLPDGDVCFIRQVLQHLSNAQIKKVLDKIDTYTWVFITEHYPAEDNLTEPNVDKVPGADVRPNFGSGVYVTEPPFNLPGEKLEKVLEVPGSGLGDGMDQGTIRTYLYKPR